MQYYGFMQFYDEESKTRYVSNTEHAFFADFSEMFFHIEASQWTFQHVDCVHTILTEEVSIFCLVFPYSGQQSIAMEFHAVSVSAFLA